MVILGQRMLLNNQSQNTGTRISTFSYVANASAQIKPGKMSISIKSDMYVTYYFAKEE